MPALRQTLDVVKERGQDLSYPLVTVTVLDNFFDFVADDLRHGAIERWPRFASWKQWPPA